MLQGDGQEILGVDRRGFLELSATGSAALSTMSWGAVLSGCSAGRAVPGMKQLRAGDVELIRAMIPCVMKGRRAPNDTLAVDRTLQSFDTLLDDVSPGAVDQLRQAFDALSFAPMRWWLTGRWSGWSTASGEDVCRSLERLRDSRFEVSNAIYGAMVRLVSISYYLLPEHMGSTGYPGAPRKVVEEIAPLEEKKAAP